MNKNALIIFVRNPILGKVKTRLARGIGDDKALKIYNQLLFHTSQETSNLNCDVFVFYDLFIDENDIWNSNIFIKKLQIEGDLGFKMQNAFETILNLNYKKCIIIGSDLFELKSQHIEDAFDKLEKNNFVIGPAQDGGYYLLGLKNIETSIFKNKNWGNDTVLKDTLINLKNYKIHKLETLNDIDTIEDLNNSVVYKTIYKTI